MTDRMGEVPDLEAPPADAYDQALPVDELAEHPPVELLSGDLEVPEPDAIEQRQPGPAYEDDSWR